MIRCIYKRIGEYNNNPYYQVGFVKPINKNGYEGEIPFEVTVIKQGNVVRNHRVSCTKDVFDFVEVGETYDEQSLLFNNYGKLLSVTCL